MSKSAKPNKPAPLCHTRQPASQQSGRRATGRGRASPSVRSQSGHRVGGVGPGSCAPDAVWARLPQRAGAKLRRPTPTSAGSGSGSGRARRRGEGGRGRGSAGPGPPAGIPPPSPALSRGPHAPSAGWAGPTRGRNQAPSRPPPDAGPRTRRRAPRGRRAHLPLPPPPPLEWPRRPRAGPGCARGGGSGRRRPPLAARPGPARRGAPDTPAPFGRRARPPRSMLPRKIEQARARLQRPPPSSGRKAAPAPQRGSRKQSLLQKWLSSKSRTCLDAPGAAPPHRATLSSKLFQLFVLQILPPVTPQFLEGSLGQAR